MSLAACIMLLALDHAFARLRVGALWQVVLEHRCRRFFDLQEQRVILVSPLQGHDERSGPDASDTDHLAGHVDHFEPLQELAAVIWQRLAVGTELVVDRGLEHLDREPDGRRELTKWRHQGRLAHDPVTAVDQLGEL